MKNPTKAVIAAAGLGTRFLPWTKSMPKEMLPVGNEPVIQHIVDGLVAAGVNKIAIVGGPQKRTIENHFGPSAELENQLRAKGKDDLADNLRAITNMAHFSYIDQKGEPAGTARPLLNAVEAGFINEDETNPFFYMYADDFFTGDVPHAKQLLDTYVNNKKSVISLIHVSSDDADRYGMAIIGDQLDKEIYQVSGLVEKPGKENAPSEFASVSGYLLESVVIRYARKLQKSKRGEIELAEAIGSMAQDGLVVGKTIVGKYNDAGDPVSHALAAATYILRDRSYGRVFRQKMTALLEEEV